MLEHIIFQFVLIFAGAALFATLFLYLKQPIILAYIVLGMCVGPKGLALISDAEQIEQLSHIGIILLLFLIGLNFQPAKLVGLLGRIGIVTLATCFIFMLLSLAAASAMGYPFIDSLIIGAALMFSSTIVSLKLIPTTQLHHHHVGEVMISVLLLQDVIAIVLILLVTEGGMGNVTISVALLLLKLVAISVVAFVFVRFVITNLLLKFDVIKEHTFVMALGWGLFVAGAAKMLGLSFEMGAFIAGISLATVPIALVIAEDLKPLRDFFLILFFFSIGAEFDLVVSQQLIVPGLIITALLMAAKPIIFKLGFKAICDKSHNSAELGVRLGQASEFSLLIAFSAMASGLIEERSSYLIQLVVVLTFVVSTYWVVNRYPTPISYKSSQRKD
ncbi:MAG: cation:proton antiporter [Oceanicoccus sp.]|uniref:cation:proton antiporter n=1 Tax=Oceanicoccus sp. TaxID=2691044 RepID=UPI002634DCDF|nr:cation:proton antiporter [Oceanicoccus sp.]MCP3908895.1 cation:proton antiporter [Oceanicoccus sp.]